MTTTQSADTALENIYNLTEDYARKRAVLADRVQLLHDDLETIKRRRKPGIKSAASAASDARSALVAAMHEAPQLFRNPKTMTLHGIKIGFQKGKGKLQIADDARTIKLLRRHYGDDAELYIIITEKPDRKALSKLPASELKKIGADITDTGEQVLIKSTTDEIDKYVDKLLSEKDPEEGNS